MILRFPDQRLASFTVSFGTAATASYRLVGTKGDLRLDQAYEYQGARRLTVTIDDKPRERRFAPSDQFAARARRASRTCVFDGREPEPSGIEGLADVRVIEAVLESIRTGAPVTLAPLHKPSRPGPEQRSIRPPVEEPDARRRRGPAPVTSRHPTPAHSPAWRASWKVPPRLGTGNRAR